MKEKIVLVSGGIDPIHLGHIKLLEEAKKLGDWLVVIVNSDEFLVRKKGFYFLSLDVRCAILESIRYVDVAIKCIDKDDSVCATLTKIKEEFPEYDFIFANGGDRFEDNIPEKEVCENLGIEMKFNVGGEKIQSSSELVNRIRK